MPNSDPEQDFIDAKAQIRVLLIIDAADVAGLTPLGTRAFHLIAYLSNVLSPLWEIPVDDGKLLRSKDGPFYPDIQMQIDRLVGKGLLILEDLEYRQTEDFEWRFNGSYRPNATFVEPIVRAAKSYENESALYQFCSEIAFSLSLIEDRDILLLNREDATYGDSNTDFENVIDFAEWTDRNSSFAAAGLLGKYLPTGDETNKAEKLHAYVQFAARRIHAWA